MVEELLHEYNKANNRLPKKIVFLRDGVSDGQFKKVDFLIFYSFMFIISRYFKLFFLFTID